MGDALMPQRLGRYELVRELGKGAMGVVYEGRDPHLNRRVAVKTARKDVMDASGMADEMMQRFLREAQASGALEHPNIITIYDAGEEGDIAWIAMEYLEGGDLRDVIEGRRSMSPAEIAEVGAVVCEALAVAHEQGIVHRDIKPANIMTPVGKPLKLTDFGIAHVSDSDLTQEGALVGTPHYMSPEQFMGYKLDGRADLFSIGVMLYELLTGTKPFDGDALTAVMHHVLKTRPAEPRALNPLVPEALSRVVMKAMEKRPQERFQNGRAMAVALRESIKPQPAPTLLGFLPAEFEAATHGNHPEEELPGHDTLSEMIDAYLREHEQPDTLIPGDEPAGDIIAPSDPDPSEGSTVQLRKGPQLKVGPLLTIMLLSAAGLALIAVGWLLAVWTN
jgi:serine/threonine protein kinase